MKRLGLAACVLLAACATTKVEVSGSGTGKPLCPADARPLTLVLWTTDWRPDQKDVAERDAAAWQAIQRFFVRSSCKTEIRNAARLPPYAQAFGKVIAITVRDFGIETRVLDGSGRPLAELRTDWQNGGPFVPKGVKTLEQDMIAALEATFY